MVTIVINQIFEPKKCFPVLPLQNRTNEEVKKKTKIHLFYFIFTLLIASIWQQWLCHMIKHPRVPLNWILSVFLELLPSRSRVNFELFFRSGMVGVMVGGVGCHWKRLHLKFQDNLREILSADAAHVSHQTWRFDFHWEYSLGWLSWHAASLCSCTFTMTTPPDVCCCWGRVPGSQGRKWRNIAKKRRKTHKLLIITYITVTLPFVEVSIAPSTFHKSFNTAIHIKALGTPAAQLKKAR